MLRVSGRQSASDRHLLGVLVVLASQSWCESFRFPPPLPAEENFHTVIVGDGSVIGASATEFEEQGILVGEDSYRSSETGKASDSDLERKWTLRTSDNSGIGGRASSNGISTDSDIAQRRNKLVRNERDDVATKNSTSYGSYGVVGSGQHEATSAPPSVEGSLLARTKALFSGLLWHGHEDVRSSFTRSGIFGRTR